MAADTPDPHLRESLVETAQRWLRLAIEIEAEVLYGAQSAAWDEAENRLHVQKALLALLLGDA